MYLSISSGMVGTVDSWLLASNRQLCKLMLMHNHITPSMLTLAWLLTDGCYTVCLDVQQSLSNAFIRLSEIVL